MNETKVFIDGKEIKDPGDMPCGHYRKKPVTISASQIGKPFEVHTLEGIMKGEPGDWLMMGVEGEYYLCKDEIFKKTYYQVK